MASSSAFNKASMRALGKTLNDRCVVQDLKESNHQVLFLDNLTAVKELGDLIEAKQQQSDQSSSLQTSLAPILPLLTEGNEWSDSREMLVIVVVPC
ncbi:hypothetical protein Tco_0643701 [Tanacetum coccineum]